MQSTQVPKINKIMDESNTNKTCKVCPVTEGILKVYGTAACVTTAFFGSTFVYNFAKTREAVEAQLPNLSQYQTNMSNSAVLFSIALVCCAATAFLSLIAREQ